MLYGRHRIDKHSRDDEADIINRGRSPVSAADVKDHIPQRKSTPWVSISQEKREAKTIMSITTPVDLAEDMRMSL